MLPPRSYEERPDWDTYFMMIALVASRRSPDPNTQVGACIVNMQDRIIATGYNGPPAYLKPECMPWDRSSVNPEHTKYPYVVHAEMNAILACEHRPEGCTIYTTLHPCNECAKAIIQSGIKNIVYLDSHPADSWQLKVADTLFRSAKLSVEQFPKYHNSSDKTSLMALNKQIHDILSK